MRSILMTATLALSITPAFANSGGRAAAGNAGATGAPGESGLTCATCHNSGSFDPVDVAVELSNDTPAPGETVTVTVTVTATTVASGYGFQLTALDAALDGAGSFTAGAGSNTVDVGTRTYIEQQGIDTDGIWEFDWTAPATPGDVEIYVMGNAVDSSGSTAGDNASATVNQTVSVVDTSICVLDDTLSILGDAIAVGSTLGAADSYEPSCGSGTAGAGDFAVLYTATVDGVHIFDTDDSAFDTTLSLWDPNDCSADIACNDDGGNGTRSLIEWDALAGDEIVVVVSGFGANEGDFSLDVNLPVPPVCDPDMDLGDAMGSAVAMGDTCGAVNDYTATCGSSGSGEDLAYLWTAPADGDYTFTTVGSSYDTVLSTVDTVSCDNAECNDDFTDFERRSSLTKSYTAGDMDLIVVHGFAGNCGSTVLNILDATIPDGDGDGFEDSVDTCLGHDLLGDDDMDNVCNDLDECVGDDATGDSDFDGICDSNEFNLTQTDIVAGQPMTFTVANAEPNSTVFFLAGTVLDSANPLCHPVVTDACTDIRRPNVLGNVTADALGNAQLTVTVPPVPSGFTVYTEAAWFRAGAGETTGVLINQAL